jgi:hypothetical protein
MTLSEDMKVEILNYHYEDSCSRLENYRQRRNRLTLYIGIALGIMYLMQLHPESIVNIIISVLENRAGIKIKDAALTTNKLPFDLAPEMLIYLFIAVLIYLISITYKRYTTAIDNQYDYIQILESKLNSYFSDSDLFTRETNFSSRENPTYSLWSNQFYDRILGYSAQFVVLLIIIKEIVRGGLGGVGIGIAFGWLFALCWVNRNRIKQFWIKLTNIFRRSSDNSKKQS